MAQESWIWGPGLSLVRLPPNLCAGLHLQIVEADKQLSRRYVANESHCCAMWIGLIENPCWDSRFWIAGRRKRAAAMAPQRTAANQPAGPLLAVQHTG